MISQLPPLIDLETKEILKSLLKAHSKISELKGILSLAKNREIYKSLILPLEARDSIAMEGFALDDDDTYKALLDTDLKQGNIAFAKRYLDCLRNSKKKEEMFKKENIEALYSSLTKSKVSISSKKIEFLRNIEEYTNSEIAGSSDILVKIALISYQLFRIRLFENGNRQISRILTLFFLMDEFKLQGVGLNLSNYLRENPTLYSKPDKTPDWESWILFFLEAVNVAAARTIRFIKNIGVVQQKMESRIKKSFPKFNAKLLAEQVCKHPVIIISQLEKEMKVTRLTALKYLEELDKEKILHKKKVGKFNFYLNKEILQITSK
jgi:Fic family protein